MSEQVKATVGLIRGEDAVTLTFDDDDDALDWFDDMVERFTNRAPNEPVTIVLTGGCFSRHTRTFAGRSITPKVGGAPLP